MNVVQIIYYGYKYVDIFHKTYIFLMYICNNYTTGCQPVRGDNPRALARGLSYVQVDKHGKASLYHIHHCRSLFVCFAALRPKSTAMFMAGRSVHLTTLEQAVNQ